MTRGSKKLDSSFGVVKESRVEAVGVLVGVWGSPFGKLKLNMAGWISMMTRQQTRARP